MIQGKSVAAVVVAAGSSARMGFDKLFYPIEGVEVLRRAVQALDTHPLVDTLVVAAGSNIARVQALFAQHPPQKPLAIVPGGATRLASVAAGAAACPGADLVAIHDGARPFVSAEQIQAVLQAAAEHGAAAPCLPVKDTIKQAADGFVAATPAREGLVAMQTPQAFERAAFLRALARLKIADYGRYTDDCMVMEAAGLPVKLVQGDEANRKITTPADLPGADSGGQAPCLRVGHGYDVHRLQAGRRLVLGGVEIAHETGLLGHSDADVLLHAVIDALLGAAALGDIGQHFPDSSPAYKDADSLMLLAEAGRLVRGAGFAAANLDATLVCQAPRLAGHIPAMRANIARALGLGQGAVSVKATTEEGLGFTGQKQGIAAHCVALLAGLSLPL